MDVPLTLPPEPGLGELLAVQGRLADACEAHEAAVALTQDNGDRLELVRARRALASLAARGDVEMEVSR